MGERKTGPKEVVLLKRWEDWSDGIGHLVDEPRVNGMYYASGLLGLRRELRPAPFLNAATGTGSAIVGYTVGSSANFALGAVAIQPTSTAGIGAVAKSDDAVTNNTTLTFSHTVAAGSDLVIYVGVSNTGGTAPSGVTYDGDALTKVGEQAVGSTVIASIWRKVLGTSSGIANVIVTIGGAQDIVAGAVSTSNVDQSTPEGTFVSDSGAATTRAAAVVVDDPFVAADGNAMIFVVIAADNVTVTVPTGTNSMWNEVENSAVRGSGSVLFVTTKFTNVNYHFHYFFEDVATSDSAQPYLYAIRGNVDGDLGVYATKVDLSNGSFGTIEAGSHIITAPLTIKHHPGQPAKYQGLWYFPSGNDQTHRELTTIGSGAVSTDTLTAAAASFAPGADHLANLNHQLVSAVKDGTNDGGVRILTVDGAPRTASAGG